MIKFCEYANGCVKEREERAIAYTAKYPAPRRGADNELRKDVINKAEDILAQLHIIVSEAETSDRNDLESILETLDDCKLYLYSKTRKAPSEGL